MKSSTNTLVTFLSGHTAVTRSGGHVISAQRAFCMSGKPLWTNAVKGQAVRSAQAGLFVNITRLPGMHLKLRCFGMQRRAIRCVQTK